MSMYISYHLLRAAKGVMRWTRLILGGVLQVVYVYRMTEQIFMSEVTATGGERNVSEILLSRD